MHRSFGPGSVSPAAREYTGGTASPAASRERSDGLAVLRVERELLATAAEKAAVTNDHGGFANSVANASLKLSLAFAHLSGVEDADYRWRRPD